MPLRESSWRRCRHSCAIGREYDLGRFARRLNALPQFMTEIDGLDIHFIHVKSPHENALPLIITRGWPGSVIEMLGVVVDEHGGLFGTALLGNDPRLFRRQGRQDTGCPERLSTRALSGPEKLG